MKRFVVTLDTGAGSRFKRLDEIPNAMGHKIRKLKDEPNVRNASGKSFPVFGTIYLVEKTGKST